MQGERSTDWLRSCGLRGGRNVLRGFALKEVLIVFALIAVLALFFQHERSEDSSIHTAALCQGNMRQLGLSLYMYAADYDERLPIQAGSFAGLVSSTSPYLRDGSCFHCPAEGAETRSVHATSYRMPPLYAGLPITGEWPDPYLQQAPADPARTLLLFETTQDQEAQITPLYRHTGATVYLTLLGRPGMTLKLHPSK